MQDSNISQVLGNIRIPKELVDDLLAATLRDAEGTDALLARLRRDRGFELRASKMVHDILVSVTLAQTLQPTEPFEEWVADASFSGDDADLRVIGGWMLHKISGIPRLDGGEIPDLMLQKRFNAISTAL